MRRSTKPQNTKLQNDNENIQVYGLSEQNTIIHISVAENGLACNCTCPSCGARLIAKQGEMLKHHFSHETKTNCGASGPETALHLLAKQILRETIEFSFPPVEYEFETIRQTLIGSKTVSITRCEYESTEGKKDFGIVPDLIFHSGDKRCQIEIAVTHKCDETKIEKLQEAGVATLEIDLSSIERDISEAELKALLYEKHRYSWIYHFKIQEKLTELKAAWQLKLQHAQEESDRRDDQIAKAYQDNVNLLKVALTPPIAIPLSFAELGLSEFVGTGIDGYACFSVSPAIWQTNVLELLAEDYRTDQVGLNSVEICKNVQLGSLILPVFRFLDTATATNICQRVKNFAAPWKAINVYLDSLERDRIVVKHGKGYLLTRTIGQEYLKHIEQKNKSERRISCVEKVINALLDQLPNDERGSLNYKNWHKQYFDANSITIEDMVNDEDAYRKFTHAAIELAKLLNFEISNTENDLGFPLGGAIERSKEDIERKRQTREDEDKSYRIKKLQNDQRLQDEGLLDYNWCSKPHLKLNGKSPIQIAGESHHGLTQAENLLKEDYDHANAVKNSSPNNSYARSKGE